MKTNRKQKRAVTLIEMMVVIVLIGIIGGALAFNMKGSLQKGKLFQTEQNCAKVYDLLMMEYAQGSASLKDIIENKETILSETILCRDGKKLLKDAWGEDLVVQLTKEGDDLEVFSKRAPASK